MGCLEVQPYHWDEKNTDSLTDHDVGGLETGWYEH